MTRMPLPDTGVEFVSIIGFLVGAISILAFVGAVVATAGEVIIEAAGEANVVMTVTALVVGIGIGLVVRPTAGAEVIEDD